MAKIINVASDVERSAPDGSVTRRSLNTKSARNESLPRRMQAVVDDAYKASSIFEGLPQIKTKEELDLLLAQLIIRFDTKPDYYTKKDYQLLLAALSGGLCFLQENIVNDDTKQDKEDFNIKVEDLTTVVGALNFLYNTLITHAKRIGDETLITQSQTLIGAINELVSKSTVIHGGYINFHRRATDHTLQGRLLAGGIPAGKYQTKCIEVRNVETTVDPYNNSCIVVSETPIDSFDLISVFNLDWKVYNWGDTITTSSPTYWYAVNALSDYIRYLLTTSQTEGPEYDFDIDLSLSDIWVLPLALLEYLPGDSIEIKDNTISAIVDEDITVSIPLGGYDKPCTIKAGQSITDVLKNLLEVVVGVKSVDPNIAIDSHSHTEEYGTKIINAVVGIVLRQGYFLPADSRWNASNQNMDCKIASCFVNGASATVLDSGMNCYVEIPEFILTAPLNYVITKNTITANTIVPKNSRGDELPEEKGFTGGTVKASSSVTFTPIYYAFVGGIDAEKISDLTSDKIRALSKHKLSINPTSVTILDKLNTSNNSKSVLIACPKGYVLESVSSELGTEIYDSFDVRGTVSVKCGELTVEYNCYLCVVYEEMKFQTIKFKKG